MTTRTESHVAAGQLLADALAAGWEVNFLSRQRFAGAAYSVSLRWTEGRTCTHIGFGCHNDPAEAIRQAHADAMRDRTSRQRTTSKISLDDLQIDLGGEHE